MRAPSTPLGMISRGSGRLSCNAAMVPTASTAPTTPASKPRRSHGERCRRPFIDAIVHVPGGRPTSARPADARRAPSNTTTGSETRLRLEAAEDRNSVLATEAKAVDDRRVDLLDPRHVGDVVEIALGIRVLQVGRGRNDAVANRADGRQPTRHSGGAEQVPDHGLG